MTNRSAGVLIAVCGLALLQACRKSTREDLPGPPQPVPQPAASAESSAHAPAARATRPTRDRWTAAAPPAAPAAATFPDAAAIPLRLCALQGSNERNARAGFIHKTTGKSAVLRVGQSFEGYELAAIDLFHEQATVRRDGVSTTLDLVAGADAPSAPPGAPSTEPPADPALLAPPTQMDVSQLRPQHFDPTPDEKSRGIDPNNPKTWPAGYRGPGIERAMQNLPAGAKAEGPVLNARPETRFDPTPDEKARGINPNDSKTWPAGYRGPGIERAIREHPEQGKMDGPTLTAPPPVENPPSGMTAPASDQVTLPTLQSKQSGKTQ